MSFSNSDYNDFVANSPQGSVFAQSWWLDFWTNSWYPILIKDTSDKIVCAFL